MKKYWAIGDLHLSFGKPRDFAKFGERWVDHTQRIKHHWEARIHPNDVVLVLGDSSWASTYKRVKPDLTWIDQLPGHKVMIRGNHDRWWRDIAEVRKTILPPSCRALQGDYLIMGNVLLCGAQGHVAPNDPYYRPDPPHNRFEREIKTLSTSLAAAAKVRQTSHHMIVMMHYPPFTSDGQPTEFTDLIQAYAPDQCLYGHLHKDYEWNVAINEERAGTQYRLLASDFIDMIPQEVYSES